MDTCSNQFKWVEYFMNNYYPVRVKHEKIKSGLKPFE
jgi:hypothetical protein